MKKAIYTILGLALLWSCDALNQYPSTSSTSDTAITNVEELVYAINGAYYCVTYGVAQTMASELAIYADLCSDDATPAASSGQNASKIYNFSLSADDTFNAYYYPYLALANVNNAIEAVANFDETEQADARPYLAELYAMRGLFHFHLAVHFAHIPTSGSSNTMGIVLSNQVYPIDYIGSRSTLDETYEQIVSDFTTAINMGENKDANTGHMNYWAALALRARAYLYWGKYDEALADCQEIINDSPYTLYTRDNYVSVWEQEGTSEMIMEYIQTDTYNAQRYAPGYYTSSIGYAEYGLSDAFVQYMQNLTDDIRSSLVEYDDDGDSPGWFVQKYPGKSGAAIPTYTNNIKVIRLSEVYLIAAEAAYRTNESNSALNYINTLRAQRISSNSALTSVDIDDIMDERRRELYGEGHRAFDVWRTGGTVTRGTLEYGVGTNEMYMVLPLPTSEMEVSNGLLVQNPGYGGL